MDLRGKELLCCRNCNYRVSLPLDGERKPWLEALLLFLTCLGLSLCVTSCARQGEKDPVVAKAR
jgi:hypothetical protein